jgi:hypothetical protein
VRELSGEIDGGGRRREEGRRSRVRAVAGASLLRRRGRCRAA